MENIAEEEINGVVILKLIDDNGRPYKVVYQDETLNVGRNIIEFSLDKSNYPKGIKDIKVYIWDSLDNMKPLADVR